MDVIKKRKADGLLEESKELKRKKIDYEFAKLKGRWNHITLVIKEQYEKQLIDDILKLSLDNIKKIRET